MIKHVNAVGIELEGAWKKSRKLHIVGDGSVDVCKIGCTTGEIRSHKLKSVNQVKKFMTSQYANAIDESCGLHVHMSFKDSRCYAILLGADYQRTLIKSLKAWGKKQHQESIPANFWSRLDGDNEYCEKRRDPIEYFYSDNDDLERYKIVNYASYYVHGTFEIRVLPMFKESNIALSAVNQVLKITNKFISSQMKLLRHKQHTMTYFASRNNNIVYKGVVV